MKIISKSGTSATGSRSLLSDREFFMPAILYQDAGSLIIATHATAKTNGPVKLQSLNVETGKIIWTQPEDVLL